MPTPNSFRNSAVMPGSPLGAIDRSVSLTADGQFVSTQGVSLIRISSDSATASSRSFTLQSGLNPTIAPTGSNTVVLTFASGSGTSALLVNSGNMRMSGDWAPTQGQSLTLMWDGFFWNELSRTGGGHSEASGTLTQANITAMNGAPVTLIPAASAASAYVVESVEFFHSYSTAAYTGGGDVTIQYDSGASVLMLFDVALVTATSNIKVYAEPTIYTLDASTGTGTGFNLSAAAGKSISVSNASAAFAAGNAANVLKYKIRYKTISVLS